MHPVLTIPVLVLHFRNQSSFIWQIEDPVQIQFNIPETNPVPVKPHMLTGFSTILVSSKKGAGRKEQREREKGKISIANPVPVLSNHSSSSSAWPNRGLTESE